MSSVRRDEDWPGFSVRLPENPQGFRIADDGSALSTPAPQPMQLSLWGNPDIGVPPAMNDLLLMTGGPIESRAMTGLPDRFVGNPYWSGERNPGSISLVVPAGYGFPFAPARPPLAEGMQTTRPLRSDLQVDAGEQDLPDAAAPVAGGSPSGISSSQSPIMVQYAPDGAPLPFPASRHQEPQEIDTSPGEVVVLPDGSTVADDKSPTGHVMSPKTDLHDVAAKGRQIGEIYRGMLANPATSAGALLYLYAALGLNAGQGGTYDHRRRGDMITGYTQLPQFRPIANVNVGLLGQQAGLTLEETLDIAGTCARLRSSNADAKGLYGLDRRTLHYITRGHEIGRTGMLDEPARR